MIRMTIHLFEWWNQCGRVVTSNNKSLNGNTYLICYKAGRYEYFRCCCLPIAVRRRRCPSAVVVCQLRFIVIVVRRFRCSLPRCLLSLLLFFNNGAPVDYRSSAVVCQLRFVVVVVCRFQWFIAQRLCQLILPIRISRRRHKRSCPWSCHFSWNNPRGYRLLFPIGTFREWWFHPLGQVRSVTYCTVQRKCKNSKLVNLEYSTIQYSIRRGPNRSKAYWL